MRSSLLTLLGILTIALIPATVSAQDAGDYHPFLSNKFQIGVGVFSPQKSFEIRVDGTVPEESIDIDESVRADNSETTPSIDFRWRFGEKWSFWGQYWEVDSQGSSILT